MPSPRTGGVSRVDAATPRTRSQCQRLLQAEQVLHARLLPPQIVMQQHMAPLTGHDRKIVGVVIVAVAVHVMHDLAWAQRPSEPPGGHGTVEPFVGTRGTPSETAHVQVYSVLRVPAAWGTAAAPRLAACFIMML